MLERRGETYTFTSEKDLVRFFREALGQSEIRDAIRHVKAAFVHRKSEPADRQTLELLKKCEFELVRLVREKAAAQRTASGE